MHFIRPGPPICLGGPEVPPCCGLPMSSHQVTRHGPSRDYRTTLPVRHSLSLPFCIRRPRPRQPPTVARFGPVSGPRPTGVTGHDDCLPDSSLQAYPVEVLSDYRLGIAIHGIFARTYNTHFQYVSACWFNG